MCSVELRIFWMLRSSALLLLFAHCEVIVTTVSFGLLISSFSEDSGEEGRLC